MGAGAVRIGDPGNRRKPRRGLPVAGDEYLFAGFDAVEEDPIQGRKAVVDLSNGHSGMLAYFSNKGDIEAQSAQFASHLRVALQQNEAYLDFEELGYEQMPPETGWAADHPFQIHGHE